MSQIAVVGCDNCSETFHADVWHCPVCAHHWPYSREECWNCYEFTRPMTKEEARECVNRINKYSENLFNEVKGLHDREGWRALGYTTFRECAIAEFKFSQPRVYQLLQAAEVGENFIQFVEKPESEGQLRELAKLRIEGSHEYDVELQQAVWQIAQNTAPVSKQGRKLITASHLKSVATVLTDVVKSGAIDDGSGEMKPLGVLVDAAVTEETYERLMRQKEHIKQSIEKVDGDEWCTPAGIIEAARKVMGGIDLDPASNELAQKTVKARWYFTKEDDGLTKKWTGRVWLNSPFSFPLIEKFIKKAIDEYESGNVSTAIILVNSSTDTDWFHNLLARFPVCFTRGRISFYHPDRTGQSNRIGQAFFYLGNDAGKFAEVFSEFGAVAKGVDG